MAIFRGVGGSGDSSDNSYLQEVTAQANAAEQSKLGAQSALSFAISSANAASVSASAASASASAASASATSALNTELTSASFNTSDGVLTLTKQDGETVTADLDGRFLTSYTETDPVFTAHVASGITATNISNWNTAYNNHITAVDYSGSTLTLTQQDGNTLTTTINGALGSTLVHSGSTKIEAISSGVTVTGDITVSGTVDGRDLVTDGTKLDGIEASADVTDTANVTSAGAAMLTGADFTGDVTAESKLIVKKYPVASDLLTTSRSIQDLAAWAVYAGTGSNYDLTPEKYRDSFDVNQDNRFSSADASGINLFVAINYTSAEHAIFNGLFGNPSNITSTFVQDVLDGDYDTDSVIIDRDASSVLTVSGDIAVGGTVDGRDVSADGDKLDLIEASADVTDATNVTAAGAAMLTGADFTGDVTTTGNVGIGTTSPDRILDIESSIPAVRFTDTSVSGLYHEIVSGDNNNLQIKADDGGVGPSSAISFDVDGSEKMRIKHTGNVGIGTNNPSALLHVNGGDLKITSDSTNNGEDGIPSILFSEITGGSAHAQISYHGDDESTADNYIGLGVFDSGSSSADTVAEQKLQNTLAVTRDNKVGINIIRPTEALDVVGNIAVSGTVDGVDVAGLSTTVAGKADLTGANFTGNVGIGAFGFPQTLSVYGTTSLYSGANVIGNIVVSGTVDGRDVATDGTKLDGLERTVRQRFQRRGYNNTVSLNALTTSYVQIGSSLRINSGATTAVENELDLNFTANFLDVNSSNEGLFVVTVDAPDPTTETTVNLGTVTGAAFGVFSVSGDFTKHFSPYCGLSKNSDGSNNINFANQQGWSYNPATDKTAIYIYPYQANTPSVGDTVYLHPFDWETTGTELNGDEYPFEAYNASGTATQNHFHQIYLGYYKPERTFKIKAKEISSGQENIQITRVAGTYSQIIGS